MNNIEKAFQNGKACIPFITAGDPNLESTKELLLKLQEAGADLIEIGIPFSDPIAEGPIIQAANERALRAGCTINHLFDALLSIKDQMHIPLIFVTYLNPIYTYGKDAFMKRCRECGIEGLRIPDLPFEEKEEIQAACKAQELSIISFVTAVSKDRIQKIVEEAEGYIYCVFSENGTDHHDEETDFNTMINTIRQRSDVPCAIDFETVTPKQAQKVTSLVDGMITGSSIVKLIEEHGCACIPYVVDGIKEMKKVLIQK